MGRNDDLRWAQVGLSSAGGVAGAALNFAVPGVGTILSGITGAISAALGLAMEPEIPKIRPEQIQALGLGMNALANLAAQSGLSQQAVGQIGQIGREERATQAYVANTAAYGLSPYDRKRIMERLLSQSVAVDRAIIEKLQLLDPIAQAQNARAVISGSATMGAQAQDIAQQQLARKMLLDRYQMAAAENFAKAMASFTAAMLTGATQFEEGQKEREAARAAEEEKRLSEEVAKIGEEQMKKEQEENKRISEQWNKLPLEAGELSEEEKRYSQEIAEIGNQAGIKYGLINPEYGKLLNLLYPPPK